MSSKIDASPHLRSSSILGLGATLVVPTAVNATIGGSLGVWWAPYPIWLFALIASGVPQELAVLVPTVLFIAAAAFLRVPNNNSARALTLSLVSCAAVVHVSWPIMITAQGALQAGVLYTILVESLGAAILTGALVAVRAGWSSATTRPFLLSVWLVFLWFAWFSVPWIVEAI